MVCNPYPSLNGTDGCPPSSNTSENVHHANISAIP